MGVILVYVPVSLVFFVALEPLLNLRLGERFAILIVGAAFLASFTAYVFTEKLTTRDVE